MVFLKEMDGSNGLVDHEAVRERGLELQVAYGSGDPFPHIVIDNFLPPEILDACLAAFPKPGDAADASFDRKQERLKESFHPDTLEPVARNLFYSFNSRPFIRVIENITGIKGLIPDPYFLGAGFHRISQGGHLSMHADFNHHKPMDLERRVNVLIYLNKGWKKEYGGQLELWDTAMTRCVQSVVPDFNRCVIFNTTEQSMHGNPQPINHPDGMPRRSIALYYYTSTWDEMKRDYTTQFHVRPGTKDSVDWQIKLTELANDIAPPLVMRNIRRLKKSMLGG
jgi:hypothetical protein